jgi:protein-S-isoprenylcysteine O-methyltransferase Ste14
MPTARNDRGSALTSLIAWTGAALFVASLGWFFYSYAVRFGAGASAAGPVLPPLLVDVGLFSVFALHHSLLARTRVRSAVERYVPRMLERSLYTWTSSLLFIAVCTLWQPVPGVLYELTSVWALVGYAVQAAGIVLTLRGASAVDVCSLAGVRPVLDAPRGTATPHRPLETSGVYGFVRHPVYLAWGLLVFGAPEMTATRFAFAAVSTLYLALAIPWEERGLLEVFGAEYEAYRERVRWRMVPGVY